MVQRLERLGDLDGGVGHAGVEERRGRLQEQNGLLQHTQHTGSAARSNQRACGGAGAIEVGSTAVFRDRMGGAARTLGTGLPSSLAWAM